MKKVNPASFKMCSVVPDRWSTVKRAILPVLMALFALGTIASDANAQASKIIRENLVGTSKVTNTDYFAVSAVFDSLQTALELPKREVCPVRNQGTRAIYRFDRVAAQKSIDEMAALFGIDPPQIARGGRTAIFETVLFLVETANDFKLIVETDEASLIQSLTAVLNGTLTNDMKKDLLSWGFVYGTDSLALEDSISVALPDSFATSVRDTGSFEYALSGLQRYTDYYYAAWGYNEKGLSRGDTLTFRTLPELASGFTFDTTALAQNSASVTLEIDDAGGQGPDTVQFVWGTEDVEPDSAAFQALSDSTGGLNHSVQISSLTRYTDYYINAMVKNLAGTASAETNFTIRTLPEAPTVNLTFEPIADVDSMAIRLEGFVTDFGGQGNAPEPDSMNIKVYTDASLTSEVQLVATSHPSDSLGYRRLDIPHSNLALGYEYQAELVAANAGGVGRDTLAFVTAPAVQTADTVVRSADTLYYLAASFDYFADVAAPTSVGFKWSLNADLSDAADTTVAMQADSTATFGLMDLPEGPTSMYYTAFATNAGGTAYGDTVEFFVPRKITSYNIQLAVNAWTSDSVAATATYGHISDWYTGNVTNMVKLFYYKGSFNSDISAWDVSSVTDMYEMFESAWAFNSDISQWDVGSVTNMRSMFQGASAFNADLSNWNTENVKDMGVMFTGASSFNQPLDSWDVSSVTDMTQMFASADAFNQPLNSWDVSSVTSMDKMFNNCDSFNQPLNEWETISLTSMVSMFNRAEAFNQDLSTWDVSGVTSMESVFEDAEVFNGELNGWDVDSVTHFNEMFNGAHEFNQPLNLWDVSRAKDMSKMFWSATAFNQSIGSWAVDSVTNMELMFYGAEAFNQPLEEWNVSNVTSMRQMFQESSFDQPIGEWDVSAVRDMEGLFRDSDFNQNISGWVVDSVTNMKSMFTSTPFNQPLASWEVGSVTDMAWMFLLSSFNQPIGTWDVSSVTDMGGMFGDSPFNQPIGSWDVDSVVNFKGMFQTANSFAADLSTWDVSAATDMTKFIWSQDEMAFGDERYAALLESWSQLPLQSGVLLDVDANICDVTYKSQIEQEFGWTIEDEGEPQGGCPEVLPSIATLEVSDSTSTSLTLNGSIYYDGGSDVTAAGFKWGFASDLSDAITAAADTLEGPFSADLDSLGFESTIYYSAYATNSTGTVHGDTLSFTLPLMLPDLTTSPAARVMETTASLSAVVESDGGVSVTDQGFIWGNQADLSDGTTVPSDSLAASFGVDLTGLTLNDSIYFTAYATTELGTGYSDTLAFKTTDCYADYQGYFYTGVVIDGECWFAENLRSENYADGTAIPNVTDNAEWAGLSTGARSAYNNSAENAAKYGLLYNDYAMSDSRGICPTGWSVPALADWQALSAAVALNSDLKSSPNDDPSWDGSNTTGFSALPGGYRFWNNGAFTELGNKGQWWTSTPHQSVDMFAYYGFQTASELAQTSFYVKTYGLSIRCKKDAPTVPVVTTIEASSVGESYGTLNGEVDFNWAEMTATGFKWGLQSDLSDGNEVAADTLAGAFEYELTDLTLGQTIYYTAFATNELGTTYGDTLSFTTTACISPTFDGYTYEVVEIGDQCWFAENLRSENYEDGTAIPNVTDNGAWGDLSTGAQCGYNNEPDSIAKYGRLYNWYAVENTSGLCPAGWHVPTDEEWTTLTNHLGGESVAGAKMKSSGSDSPAWDGTNSSGFSGLPGGGRFNFGNFTLAGDYGYWWSSSLTNTAARNRFLNSDSVNVTRIGGPLKHGYSVRCLQETPTAPAVTTSEAINVGVEAGTLQGSVEQGVLPITATGFKWGTAADLSDGTEVAGDTLGGTFGYEFMGLPLGQTIHYTAFATNALGTTYGDTLSFTTNACTSPTFDGYTYDVIYIGDQCWFAENLRSTKYNDDAVIPSGLDADQWAADTVGAMTIYEEGGEGQAMNLANYGRLYNWYAVNTGKLCPSGWHVPSDDEWTTLTDYLGGATVAGAKLKSSDSDTPAWDGTNSSGFSGLPGGKVTQVKTWFDVGSKGSWWSSTHESEDYRWYSLLRSESDVFVLAVFTPKTGLSVRCLQDTPTAPAVTTSEAINVGVEAGTLQGSVEPGVLPITATGFKWGTAADLSDGTEVAGDTLGGTFGYELTGLEYDQTFYFTSFATNALGTTYGDTLSFTTAYCTSPSFHDYSYDVVQIGNRCWFAENLRNEHYADGTPIPYVSDDTAWGNSSTGAQSVYGNDEANGDLYGRLYNWYAVDNSSGLCPTGWRVPVKEEFDELSNSFSENGGEQLKATSPAWNGTNTSGFSALPGGARGNNGNYVDIDNRAIWWSGSVNSEFDEPYLFSIATSGFAPSVSSTVQEVGYSVRCVRPPLSGGVTTLDAINRDTETGTLQGNVGESMLATTATGFKWGFAADLSDGTEVAGDTLAGTFGYELTGLSLGQTIYYTAFVTNSLGTTYGDTLSFMPTVCIPHTFDGYTYDVVEIGDQCWFAENLRSENYADGTAIPNVTDNGEWGGLSTGAQCGYNNDSDNIALYGRLYNWYAVDDPSGLCPSGWHVPSEEEWTTLTDYLGSVPGYKMKATSGWPEYQNGSDESGFSGLPGGFRYQYGFLDIGNSGSWWSASPYGTSEAWRLTLSSGSSASGVQVSVGDGMSVRCIQNDVVPEVTTSEAINVGVDAGTLQAEVIEGVFETTATGFKWGTAADLSDGTEVSGDTLGGTFGYELTGLTLGQTIHYTAFATNELGTVYGDTLSFTTTACISPTFDGYTYEVVEIGDQCWFKENLRSTSYNDESMIPSGLDDSEWSSTTEGAVTVYGEGGDNETANLATFGRLYNWHAVNTGKLCPSGWHVPTYDEWTALKTHLGPEGFEAPKMRSSASDIPAWNGTNSSGFSGLPGGVRLNTALFKRVDVAGSWWSSSLSEGEAWFGYVDEVNDPMMIDDGNLRFGLSVRCIQNDVMPVVTTSEAINVGVDAGTLQAEVIEGVFEITATGFKWGTAADLSDGAEVAGDTLGGTFGYELTGLTLGQTIHYTAFATNALGTTYGDTLSFTTTACISPTFDGYTYEVVEIGDQCWFAENLQTTIYSDDTPISSGLSDTEWATDSLGATAVYQEGTANESANLELYGRLYNAHAAHSGKLCPTDWHVPSESEMLEIVDLFGGIDLAGAAFKSTSTDVPSADGTNSSGMSLAFVPTRNSDGTYYEYLDWAPLATSTIVPEAQIKGSVFYFDMYSGWDGLGVGLEAAYASPRDGIPVRCVQDTEPHIETLEPSIKNTATSIEMRGLFDMRSTSIDEVGFKWGLSSDLSDGTEVIVESDPGNFVATIEGLTPGTAVYYTPFATNSLGTVFGDTVSVTPEAPAFNCGVESVNFAGREYSTVVLGNDCWFAENLATRVYNNGDSIPLLGMSEGYDQASPVMTIAGYGTADEDVNLETYGGLYNDFAVRTGMLCPTGWKIPNDDEWRAMATEFGGMRWAGDYLKATAENVPSLDGNNQSGFTAIPGGMATYTLVGQYFGERAYFWSETIENNYNTEYYLVSNDERFYVRRASNVNWAKANSVRCVIDKSATPLVVTSNATNVSESSGTLVGEVGFNWDGITATGFKWGTAADLSDGTEVAGDTLGGTFGYELTGLTASQTYYFAAFATNELGTTYGDTLSFTTSAPTSGCVATEFNGYTYEVVEIGDQCWFAENLRSANFANGDAIPSELTDAEWASTQSSARYLKNPPSGRGPQDQEDFPLVAEIRIDRSMGDVEQTLGDVPSLDGESSDIELIDDGDEQAIGLWFPSLPVRGDAVITEAYIQFTVDEASADTTNLVISVEDNAAPEIYDTSIDAVTSRVYLDSTVAWNDLPEWTVEGEQSAAQRTPDLSGLVQSIVLNENWEKGNPIAFKITGSGERVAEAFDGGGIYQSPVLVVRYTYGSNKWYTTEGALYNGYAVSDPRGLCPSGWHVSSSFDWDAMIQNLGGAEIADALQAETNDFLSDADFIRWSGSNTSGFSAYQNGFRDHILGGPVNSRGAHWWTSDLNAENGAAFEILEDSTAVSQSNQRLRRGMGVRCVKDAGLNVLSYQVNNSLDDVEEEVSTGDLSWDSSDLELIDDGSDQLVGIRFTGIEIPQGTVIESAQLQFTVDEASTDACELTISIEDSGNSQPFTDEGTTHQVSSRTLASTTVSWSPEGWSTPGDALEAQKTPDLSALVQEVLNRSDWASLHAMTFVISGTGVRIAEAYDGESSAAPVLRVVYAD